MTFRRYMVLVAVMVTAAFGDTFLSAGMKQIGPVSIHHLSTLLLALRSPWIVAGTILLTVFFASYLTALTWADLTFVLPATSLGYVIIPLLAHFWLHENISPTRWIGILLVALGVGFVMQGPSYTHHAVQVPTEETISVSDALEVSRTPAKEHMA